MLNAMNVMQHKLVNRYALLKYGTNIKELWIHEISLIISICMRGITPEISSIYKYSGFIWRKSQSPRKFIEGVYSHSQPARINYAMYYIPDSYHTDFHLNVKLW